MPNFYVYLISSLPMLRFEDRPPFSFENFISKCDLFIPGKDLRVLRSLILKDLRREENKTIKKFIGFETLLKNELVKLRALRKKIPAEKYLRPDGYAAADIYHLALTAQRSPSPLEAERILDQARWAFLEDLAYGHFFDLDFLIVYALKLLILERWEKINKAEGLALLEDLIAAN